MAEQLTAGGPGSADDLQNRYDRLRRARQDAGRPAASTSGGAAAPSRSSDRGGDRAPRASGQASVALFFKPAP